MANAQVANGFNQFASVAGGSPSFHQSVAKILAANATPIYSGDPVTMLATGYITRATAGTTSIRGIFVGCKYLSVSQRRPVWSPYWPGADANGDVEAYIIDDPSATFKVRAGGSATPIGQADIGANVNFGLGTGNAATGLSGAYADQTTLGTTSTLPFRIIGLVQDPPGADGADITTGYNAIVVAFNFQDFKQTTGV